MSELKLGLNKTPRRAEGQRGVFQRFQGWCLMRLLLSPDEARFSVRGFSAADDASRQRLEAIGGVFIQAYNAAVRAEHQDHLAVAIRSVAHEYRGFAAEGATMGIAVRDALPFEVPRLQSWLATTDREFSYLTHVGAGWAMARVAWRRSAIRAVVVRKYSIGAALAVLMPAAPGPIGGVREGPL